VPGCLKTMVSQPPLQMLQNQALSLADVFTGALADRAGAALAGVALGRTGAVPAEVVWA